MKGHMLYDSVCIRCPEHADLEGQKVVARSSGEGEWRVIASGYRVSFGADENVLNLIVVMIS